MHHPRRVRPLVIKKLVALGHVGNEGVPKRVDGDGSRGVLEENGGDAFRQGVLGQGPIRLGGSVIEGEEEGRGVDGGPVEEDGVKCFVHGHHRSSFVFGGLVLLEYEPRVRLQYAVILGEIRRDERILDEESHVGVVGACGWVEGVEGDDDEVHEVVVGGFVEPLQQLRRNAEDIFPYHEGLLFPKRQLVFLAGFGLFDGLFEARAVRLVGFSKLCTFRFIGTLRKPQHGRNEINDCLWRVFGFEQPHYLIYVGQIAVAHLNLLFAQIQPPQGL